MFRLALGKLAMRAGLLPSFGGHVVASLNHAEHLNS